MSETENENQTSDEQTPPVEEAATETPAGEETSPEAPAADPAPTEAAEASDEADAPEEEAPPAAAAAADDASAAAVAAEEAPVAAAEKRKSRKRLPRSERHKHSKPKRERPAQRKPITRLAKPEGERGRRQERRGVVVSSAMDKTIVVKVDTIKSHPRYKKVVRRSIKFQAHDPENKANVGDVVRIVETRPISKSKNWRLAEVVEAAR
jgi:small subunit ribosomal protein S17